MKNKWHTEYLEPIGKDKVIKDAVLGCYKMLYAASQPSADFDELMNLSKEGKEDEDFPFYKQHYLSEENYDYIINMFLDAYGLIDGWEGDCDIVLDYLENGGHKDIYVTPEDGSPNYRSQTNTPPLKDLIGQDNAKKVTDLIRDCKQYYNRNQNESTFRFNIMNCSPTSDKNSVQEYWRSKGQNIKIEDLDIVELLYPF